MRRQVTAVVRGHQVTVSGPAELVEQVPLPVGRLGCALLPGAIAPQPLAAGAAKLSADAAGRPANLAWTTHGRAAQLEYSDYQNSGGQAYAATLTETVAGRTVLEVRLASATPRTFADSEFAPPPSAATAVGGGQ